MRKGPEYKFQVQVCQAARQLGWMPYYHFETRGSVPGWPDLTLVRERIVFAELKTGSVGVTLHQEDCIQRLREAGGEVYVWRESDWDELLGILEKREEP